MNEFGVPSYKHYVDGDAMMFVDSKKYRGDGDGQALRLYRSG